VDFGDIMSRAHAQAILTAHFGHFGPLSFPYHRMGNIDSLHLFGEPELEIFAIYNAHRGRWKRCLDIGANLGLHSIIMAKCGFKVLAYEPDPEHFEILCKNLKENYVRDQVTPFKAAVHTHSGEARFVRVLNNLTGNHIEGFKDSYGPRETITVATVDARPLWSLVDFAKIDCEGNEAAILCDTTAGDWRQLAAVVEVRNTANASAIYRHLCALEVPMWSAKRDWARVKIFGDVPNANSEGALYIGHKGPWE
jgi:FkbM family methyltransferase